MFDCGTEQGHHITSQGIPFTVSVANPLRPSCMLAMMAAEAPPLTRKQRFTFDRCDNAIMYLNHLI